MRLNNPGRTIAALVLFLGMAVTASDQQMTYEGNLLEEAGTRVMIPAASSATIREDLAGTAFLVGQGHEKAMVSPDQFRDIQGKGTASDEYNPVCVTPAEKPQPPPQDGNAQTARATAIGEQPAISALPESKPDPLPIEPKKVATMYDDASRIQIRAKREEQGHELIRAASGYWSTLEDTARSDYVALAKGTGESTQKLRPEKRKRKTRERLKRLSEVLDQAESGLEHGEKERFQSLVKNAIERLDHLDAIQPQVTPATRESALRSPASTGDTSVQRSPSADVPPLSQTALVDRLIMLNAMEPEELIASLPNLKLVTQQPVRLKNGIKTRVILPHNGYLLGGGDGTFDCSRFISSLLPTDVSPDQFNTDEFKMMWIYRRTGLFPRTTKYKPDRIEQLRETSRAFFALDPYRGDPLLPGDLLVYRVDWEKTGHVFLIKKYDPITLKAHVIEASQSGGSIRERDLALSLFPADAPKRYLRPGLHVLRLKPHRNPVCVAEERGPGKVG